MEKAVWLASIFGPLLALIGLWALLNNNMMVKMVNSMKTTLGAFYLTGVYNFLVGMAILTQYDRWSKDIYVLVTILGWFLVLRGLLVLFAPQIVIKHTMTGNRIVKTMGIVPFVWGLALCWLAFMR